jgi:homoserine acetyltransferase
MPHFSPRFRRSGHPQIAHFAEPLALDCGRSLADYEIVYETYGTLNATTATPC